MKTELDKRANDYASSVMAETDTITNELHCMIAKAYTAGAISDMHEPGDTEGDSNTESQHQIYGYRLGYKKAMANAWHWINEGGTYDALKPKFDEFMSKDRL